MVVDRRRTRTVRTATSRRGSPGGTPNHDHRRETPVTTATTRRRSHRSPKTKPPSHDPAADRPTPATPTVIITELARSGPPHLGVDHPAAGRTEQVGSGRG